MKRALLALLLLSAPAWATLPEIPANGVDDGDSSGTKGSCPAGYADAVIGDGCDLLLTGTIDKDNDGYTSTGAAGKVGVAYKDCDDTNRFVFPGNYYACDCGTGANSGYRLCNTDGTYGTCTCTATTPLDESGSGNAYYIDFEDGNDANAGTYAAPFKTLAKVSGGYTCTGQPASPVTLAADDVVYIINDGTYSDSINCDGIKGLFVASVSGTSSSHRITMKRYPGATATLTGASDVRGINMALIPVSHWKLEDLDISMGTAAVDSRDPIYLNGYHDVEISRCYIHDSAGEGNNDFSGIYAAHGNQLTAHHNWLKDIKRSTGNVEQTSSIKWIDDPGGTEGADHYAYNNVIWYSTYDEANNGECIRMKHGTNTSAETGTNGHRIHDNYCINGTYAVTLSGGGLRARRNLYVVDDATTTYQTKEFGNLCRDSGRIEDAIIEYNTMVGGSRWIDWRDCGDTFTNAEKLTQRYNVAIAQSKAYDGDQAFYGIQRYGAAAELAAFESIGALVSDYNCYYGNQTLYYAYFAFDGGGRYSFANWKSTEGYDTHSYEENPTLDGYYVAGATNCINFGWLLDSEFSSTTAVVAAIANSD